MFSKIENNYNIKPEYHKGELLSLDLNIYKKKYYDYNTFLRRKFGCKVFKITLDAGFTCPNIDGKVGRGGCIYCNNQSFSPAARYQVSSLQEQIEIGKKIGKKFKAKKFIAYLQAHTNTYSTIHHLKKLYSAILDDEDIVGIAIGTRPDAVDLEKIEFLEELAVKNFVSIEYGLQSTSNEILKWINRGHSYESFLKAVEMTRNRGIHICTHLMFGFPQESKEEFLRQVQKINSLEIQGIKIHNLLITKDTKLADLYQENPFLLYKYEEYIELVCDFLERLSPEIVVERLFATTSKEYLIAPEWKKSPGQITTDITKELEKRESYQGKFFSEKPKSNFI